MNIGKFKLYFDRWKSYISTVQFLMIVAMFAHQSATSWWLILAGFIASIGFMYIDVRYIIQAEYGAGQKKNMELNNRLTKIEWMLEQLLEGKK